MKPEPGESSNVFFNAQAYDAYVGRWSQPVAARFLAWLNVPPDRVWLDVGAGTGILTQAILEAVAPARVVGIDSAAGYLDAARARIRDERVEFRVQDVATLDVEPPAFDAAVAGLVLNFVPSPDDMARRMAQAVRPGGTVAAYVWDYGGQMEMMRHFWDAAAQVDPTAATMDAGPRFTICRPDNLRALFESVALAAVEVIPIDVPTNFRDFDDFWLPFLGAQGSVSTYLHSLTDERRDAIREQLRRQLPFTPAGEIHLIARAWAVKGTR